MKEFLNKYFFHFTKIEEKWEKIQMILFYICSQFLEDTWVKMFEKPQRDIMINLAIDCDKGIDLLWTAWIKFVGSIVNYEVFNKDKNLIEWISIEIFKVKDEQNMQVCMKASWTLANITSAKDTFYSLDIKV